MSRLGFCIIHEHDPRVLALAVVLMVLTLVVSSRLLQQSQRRSRHRPEAWIAMGGLCVASGAWSVHFMAMVAYLPGVPASFAAGPTLISFLIIAFTSLLAFPAVFDASRPVWRAACGAIFGLGVSAMHYVGMSGFQAPGRLRWSLDTAAESVVLSVLLCSLGFLIGAGGEARREARTRRLLIGGLTVVMGVLTLHFVGMSALAFQFDPRIAVRASLISRPLLAAMVSVASALIPTLGLVGLYYEHRDRQRGVRRMKLLSESSFEGVALLRGGEIIEANAQLAAVIGAPRGELLKTPFLERFFVTDPGHSFTSDGRAEGQLMRANGRPLPVEVLTRPVGPLGEVIVAVRDLTERRQKEESLGLLFHRNPAPVWVCDRRGALLAVNPAALELYGYSEAQFLSLSVSDLLPADEYAETSRLMLTERRYVADRVWRHVRADGSELLVLPYAESLQFEGRWAFMATIFDVTERERTALALHAAKEAAEAASVAKSTFLANMSHEVRTPLNGVLGMSQAIEAGELSRLQRERMGVVLQSGRALARILDDVLDLSNIETGRIELSCEPFAVEALVGEVAAAYAEAAQAKGLAFDVEIDAPALPRYIGDVGRVRQILSNLISNAVKFTAKGGVRLSAGYDAAGALTIRIADTGEGMTPELLEQVFHRFVQADGSTTRRHGGAGLGLALSRELVRLMGGDIGVESRLGQGSVFTVTLPLLQAPFEAEATPPVQPREDDLRILVAEDNPTNQLVLRTLLAQDGFQLTMVDDGAQALETWRAQRFDVILMDVQMPVMDGPSAMRAIRAEEQASGRARVPILAVTANVMKEQLLDYRAAGMDGYVAKPIDAERLYDALGRAIDGAAKAAAA